MTTSVEELHWALLRLEMISFMEEMVPFLCKRLAMGHYAVVCEKVSKTYILKLPPTKNCRPPVLPPDGAGCSLRAPPFWTPPVKGSPPERSTAAFSVWIVCAYIFAVGACFSAVCRGLSMKVKRVKVQCAVNGGGYMVERH